MYITWFPEAGVRWAGWTALLPTGLAMLVGCAPASLPETATLADHVAVPISPDQTVEAVLGSGAPQLRDSSWAVHRSSDDTLLFRIEFGPDGEVLRLFDNSVFGQPWLGEQIIPDGQPHSTVFAGGQYVSGAYAAEDGSAVGVLGVLHGLFGGAHVGTATLGLYGSVEAERFTGTMTRDVTVLAATPFPAPDDAEFEAYAVRE